VRAELDRLDAEVAGYGRAIETAAAARAAGLGGGEGARSRAGRVRPAGVCGLARLQDRVDLRLDHVERHSGLRSVAVHLLGIGTAAEFSWENHPHLRRAELVG
jgi:hypothetical protein